MLPNPVEPLRASLRVLYVVIFFITLLLSHFHLHKLVAAEYKTNHHLYAAARSPEVKMSESKVRLQMVNVKYNYFRLHAL